MKDNFSERYSRQILLDEIGERGQKILNKKTIAIVGLGALGSSSAELLVRMGVKNIFLIDRDVVELSNLQRQTLYSEKDVGKSKVSQSKKRLVEINSEINIKTKALNLNAENVDFLKEVDLILDCTDNLKTRFLINDFCKKNKIPWIYSSAIKTKGYVLPIFPDSPCLSCFLKESNLETCDTVGVLNTITTNISSLQATLTLKILLNKEVNPILYYVDIWKNKYKQIQIKKKKSCKTCQNIYPYLSLNESQKPVRFCASGKYQINGKIKNFQEIENAWKKLGVTINDGITLRFKNITLFKDGRALIKTDSEEEAISIYSKYIGN